MAFSLNGIPIGGSFKAQRKRFGVGGLIFIILFGAVFVGAGLLFVKDDLRSQGWTASPGVISAVNQSRNSDGQIMYTPTVSYSVDGESYTATQSYATGSSYSVGEKQTVHYNPSNPSEGVIRTSGTNFFIYIFPLIGIAAIIFGIVSFIRDIRRSGRINALKSTGIKIQGVVTDISNGGSSNNSSSTITVSAVNLNGQAQQYTSDAIGGIGIVGLADYQTKPVAIDVYIDGANPDSYYVDLDDIPNITPERIGSLLQSAMGKVPSAVTTPSISGNLAPAKSIDHSADNSPKEKTP